MKLAIFDMDGLLFDTERLIEKCLHKIMAERGYTLTHEIFEKILGVNAVCYKNTMLEIFGENYPHDEISGTVRIMANERMAAEGVPIKTGISELLQYLYENGIKCAVASSTDVAHVKNYIKSCGFDKYFDAVIGGNMVENSKPAPDIFLKACEETGIDPHDAVVFEDSENGIRAAVNADIPVICIFDMKRHSKEICDMCLACVDNAFEALDFLKNNNNFTSK